MKTNVNVWKQGLEANSAIKNQMQSLEFICKTMNDMAREKGNIVSEWFDSIGLDRMPKSGKPSDKGVFLTSDLVVKFWAVKNNEGEMCALRKGVLVPITKFSPFAVIKACYNLHKQAVSLERKAKQAKAKEAQKEAKKVAA